MTPAQFVREKYPKATAEPCGDAFQIVTPLAYGEYKILAMSYRSAREAWKDAAHKIRIQRMQLKGEIMPEVNDDGNITGKSQVESLGGPGREGGGTQGASGAGSERTAGTNASSGDAVRALCAHQQGVSDGAVTLEQVARYHELREFKAWHNAAARAIRLAIERDRK